MKRKSAFVGLTVIVLAGLVTGQFAVLAQENGEKANETAQEPARSQAMMKQCMQMMSSMGMSEEMMKRMDAMMKTPIFLDSPCAVYGQAERLGLSDEQKQRLVQLENEARKKALAVLTPEQRQTVGDLPETPMPMMKMCEMMMTKMGKHMGEGGPMGMMQKMQGGPEKSEKKSKSENAKQSVVEP